MIKTQSKRLIVSGCIVILIVIIAVVGWRSEIQAQSVGQVQLQQESIQRSYEGTFPPGSSYIVPSVSNTVQVSVTVLENLHLSVIDGTPKYGTNWRFGATLHTDWIGESEVLYTVTADY